MIPDHDAFGNLPPGIHQADWSELEARFGGTPHRRQLLAGLRRAAENLKAARCRWLYVDGSFVTTKVDPSDFDGCWDPVNVDGALLDPVLLTFDPGRLIQKVKYGGELFPSSVRAKMTPPWRTFVEFFQEDSRTGARKGIIEVDLERLT